MAATRPPSKRSQKTLKRDWRTELKELEEQEQADKLRKTYRHLADEVASIPDDMRTQYTFLSSTRAVYALRVIAKATDVSIQSLIRQAVDEFISRELAKVPRDESVKRSERRRSKRAEKPEPQQLAASA